MKRTLTFLLTGSLLSAAHANADPPINVLIVDGYSNHDWRHTSECVLALLTASSLCEVTVITAPVNDAPGHAAWRPDFGAFDVVIQVANSLGNGNAWPAAARKDFETYVHSGGGLLVLHGANNAFPEWDAYNRMIGLGWRKADQGDALEIVDGRVVRLPRGAGSNTHHGPRSDLVVRRFSEHPITRGYPPRWKTTDIELYKFARGPALDLTVLSYGVDRQSGRGWPLEWVVSYGKGRVYNGTFGHVWRDRRRPPAMRCAGFQTTLVRAVQWLAGRDVTCPVPENFPGEDQVSLRDFELVYRESEGWQSLFNGRDLAGWTVQCPPTERRKTFWTVVEGAIECDALGRREHDYHWLTTDAEFGDFELRLKFQVFAAHTGNSGVQFRSRYDTSVSAPDGAWMNGPQVDIHPPSSLRTGLVYDETHGVQRWIHPSLPDWSMVPEKAPKSAHETRLVYADEEPNAWNELEIICEGLQVRTFVNGRRVTDFDGAGVLDDAAHRRHQVGLRGHLALQLHRNDETRIRFKDIRIRGL